MYKKIICSFLVFINLILIYPVKSAEINDDDISSTKYVIFIDLNSFTLSLIDKETEEIVRTYPVAIGKKDTPSPIGTFQIKSKALMKGPFGGYWLGLNAPWDTFGIHGTSNPGSIGSMASNGCIRLYNHNIRELFDLVEYDTVVVISGGPNWQFSPYTRVMKPNCKGADVYHIQRIMNALGYYNKEADGIYDYSLEQAIIKYKKQHELSGGSEIDREFLDYIGCTPFE